MNNTTKKMIEEREAKAASRAVAKRKAIEDAVALDWADDGTALVTALGEKIFALCDLQPDSRWTNWIKEVTSVDLTRANGYAFRGDLLKSGTIEITKKRRVWLLCSCEGSRKNKTNYYRVAMMATDGTISQTAIETDSDEGSGWALRIRKQVAALLAAPKAAESVQAGSEIIITNIFVSELINQLVGKPEVSSTDLLCIIQASHLKALKELQELQD